MHHVFGNADLFQIFFPGIGVVGVHNDGRVDDVPFVVGVQQSLQVFIMVVGHVVAEFVHITPQNSVGQRVSFRAHFPPVEQETLFVLGRFNRIHHDADVAAGGVLHAYGNAHAAGDHPVQLVFHGTGADGCIG